MGKIKEGILGGFSGTVGPVVGSSWRGLNVIRSRPPRRRRGSSELQLRQMSRVALMVSFVSPLASFLKEAYDCVAGGRMSAYNKCMSYNLRNAIEGETPDFKINFSRFTLGTGDLLNPDNPKAASHAKGRITFSWDDNSLTGSARASDVFFFAIFCEVQQGWRTDFGGARRNAGSYELEVATFSGTAVQTYFGFQSADGRFVSTSVYTGQVHIL